MVEYALSDSARPQLALRSRTLCVPEIIYTADRAAAIFFAAQPGFVFCVCLEITKDSDLGDVSPYS